MKKRTRNEWSADLRMDPGYTHLRPFFYLCLAILLWEGNLVVGRADHEHISPLNLAFCRWLLAAIILTFIAFPSISSQWRLMIQNWEKLFFLGLTGMAGYSFFLFKALQNTTAINVAVLVTLIPILILFFSWLFYGKAIRINQIIGTLISFSGALIIVTQGHPFHLAGFRFNAGDLWMLAALPVWAIYTILLKKVPESLPLTTTLAGSAYAGILVLLPFLWFEDTGSIRAILTYENLLAILYIGGVASVGAFFFWNKGVAKIGANRAGVFLYLTPVIATILSVFILGETFYAFHAAGMALVLTGLVLVNKETGEE